MLNTSEIEQLTQIVYQANSKSLQLESKIQDLLLYNSQVELIATGIVVANLFETNPLLPGVVFTASRSVSRDDFSEKVFRIY
jgi:two-component system NtrC family sensor kinase